MVSVINSLRNVVHLLPIRRFSPLTKTVVAVGAYAVWTATTWLLEGRIQTLLRPEATVDRVVYTGVANVLVGTILALWLVREFVASGFVSRRELGFQSLPRTIGAVLVAGVLGIAVYLLQQPPSTDPVVVVNAFAQVLPVSIAELVICWIVVGGSVAALLRHRGVGNRLADGVALVVASALFGVYHFAHSPPFNTPEMVGLLTLVSVGTGLFYFVGHSVYGALVFHNFLALFGVTTALLEADQLGTYQEFVAPLLVTAVVAAAILIAMDVFAVRSAALLSPTVETIDE